MAQKAISGPFFFAPAGAAGGRLVRQKQGQYLFERALGVRHVAGRRIPDPGAICPLAKRMRPLLIPPDTGQQLDQEVDPRSVHALAHVVGSGIMRRPGAYRALDPEIGQGGAHDPGPQLFLAPPPAFRCPDSGSPRPCNAFPTRAGRFFIFARIHAATGRRPDAPEPGRILPPHRMQGLDSPARAGAGFEGVGRHDRLITSFFCQMAKLSL